MSAPEQTDHTAEIAVALFMANILFIIFGGIFYLALWVLVIRRYNKSSTIVQNHLKQALIAASVTSIIFIAINIFILSTGGYVPLSRSSIIVLEMYGLLILPSFMGLGVYALFKAFKKEDVRYPVIGRLV